MHQWATDKECWVFFSNEKLKGKTIKNKYIQLKENKIFAYRCNQISAEFKIKILYGLAACPL